MKDVPKYQIVKELGSGAFGFVYQAFDQTTSKKVAIKRIEKVGKQLSREYEVLLELKEALHCVNLLDCFYTRNPQKNLVQNMVFEFLEDDLEKVISKCREKGMEIPERLIKLYAYQIFKGLDEIHQRNIIHRDLKPENILKGSDDIIKVADFGSSKFIENGSKNTPYIVSRYYRAPELLLCMTNYNSKIDVWAAGCIIAELVNLQPLFKGRSEGDQLFTIFKCLGTLSQSEIDFFIKYSPVVAKFLDKIPPYTRDEIKLADLYNKFSDPHSAKSFFDSLFKFIPNLRISAAEALNHRFFAETRIDYETYLLNKSKGATSN